MQESWREGGREGGRVGGRQGGREVGGGERGAIRMNHGAVPWGEFHFITA